LKCTKPIYLDSITKFPCGKCENCETIRKMEWGTRLKHELETVGDGVFLTLTYKDEHLPYDGSISKDVIQRFFKRFRKLLFREDVQKISYYSVGDYGELNDRPHYHSIIFGIDKRNPVFNYTDFKKGYALCESWTNGFVHVGTVTEASIHYVTGYVTRAVKFINSQMQKDSSRQLPFHLMSKGIGKDWCLLNSDQLKTDLSIVRQDVQVPISRYYKTILEIPTNPDITNRLEKRQYLVKQAKFASLMSITNSPDELKLNTEEMRRAIQTQKNREAKERLKKSKSMR